MKLSIPSWVDKGHIDIEARRQARINYLFRMAAIAVTGKGSIRALAKHCKIDPSTLSHAEKRGRCSAEIAVRIEAAVGRELLTHDMLTEPMGVPLV